MVVDSGTMFTMLPSDMHHRLTMAFRRRAPTLRLHFAGNASLWLPTRNYFFGFESEGECVVCLMLMSIGC
ncbi:hypothetical protein KSP40_PGU003783 [Platanthera guangdongensis]|uniref:Uncharacterized protein n=1 Tax=Platanthera guangdongensis TaxID=2320717 RepID=A0ABR2M9S2_9ASPA